MVASVFDLQQLAVKVGCAKKIQDNTSLFLLFSDFLSQRKKTGHLIHKTDTYAVQRQESLNLYSNIAHENMLPCESSPKNMIMTIRSLTILITSG